MRMFKAAGPLVLSFSLLLGAGATAPALASADAAPRTAAAVSGALGWQTLSTPQYSVRLPGKASATKGQVKDGAGKKVPVTQYKLEHQHRLFLTASFPLRPNQAINLGKAVSAFASATKGKVVSRKAFKVQGNPALQAVMTSRTKSGLKVTGRVLFVDGGTSVVEVIMYAASNDRQAAGMYQQVSRSLRIK